MGGHGTASKATRGCITAIATVLLALAAGPFATVAAASPGLTIDESLDGSVTNVTTPEFNGTTTDALDPVTLEIHEGSGAQGPLAQSQVVAPEGIAWKAQASSLADGTYTAVAKQTETGEEGQSSAVTFTVDATAPDVTLNPVSALWRDSTPTFTGTAGNAAGDLSTVTVTVYAGASVGGSVAAVSSVPVSGGNWSFTPSQALADGTYTVQATQSDKAGNLAATAAATFTVDETSPAVTLSSVSTPTQNATPTFGGGGGNASGDSQSVNVTIYAGGSVGGSVVSETSASVNGSSWSSTSAHLADGTYTVRATQSDAAGNVGTSAPSTFTVDTSSPVVSLNAVSTPTKNATPTFGGGGGNASGDSQSVNVTIYAGGSVGGSVVSETSASVNGSSWSSTSAHLADGTYTVQATQSDTAGNMGASTASTFTVDTAPPSVSANSVGSPTKERSPTFNGSASSATGDLSTVTVTVYTGGSVGGSVAAVSSVSVSSGKWSFTPVQKLSDGVYTVQATQSDTAGNTAASQGQTFRVDTKAPAVTLVTPANKQALKDEKVLFSGSAGNAEGDATEVTLSIYEAGNSKALQIVSISRKGGSTWKFEGLELPAGDYSALATQSDSAGNVGISSLNAFSIKTNAPTLTLDTSPFTHRGEQLVTGSATPHFSSEPAAGLKSATLSVYGGTSASGTPLEQVSMSASGSIWSADPQTQLSDGLYTAQVEVEDFAGNPGVSKPVPFSVDTTPPVVTLTTPVNGSSAGGEVQLVEGRAGTAVGDLPAITVQLFAGSAIEGQAPVESVDVNSTPSGSWSVPLGGLASGAYTVRAIQRDDVGNQGDSTAATFTLTAPPVTHAPPPPTPPVASFTWVPANPIVGQTISLVSNSTDASSPINAFAWDLLGAGPFTAGGPVRTTSFATAGHHVVRLQVTDAIGQSAVVAKAIDVTAIPLTLMQPFPIVRIAGSETAYGVKVRLLTVQAPVAARVTVTCRGSGCKTKSESRVAVASKKKGAAALLAFHRFERQLRSGVTLQIRVTKPGQIGKYTSFTIRRKKLPVRTDACLRPTSSKPVSCPSS